MLDFAFFVEHSVKGSIMNITFREIQTGSIRESEGGIILILISFENWSDGV